MKICTFYSHLNGYEFLLAHKKSLRTEIEDVIADADASVCRTKESKERRTKGRLFYSPKEMSKANRSGFGRHKWSERRISYWMTSDVKLIWKTLFMNAAEQRAEIEAAGYHPMMSYNQTDFVKERVAVEVQFGKYAFNCSRKCRPASDITRQNCITSCGKEGVFRRCRLF